MLVLVLAFSFGVLTPRHSWGPAPFHKGKTHPCACCSHPSERNMPEPGAPSPNRS